MRNLFAYVLRYWKRLVPAIIASFIMRIARLVPALTIAAAIDRVLSVSGETGLLAAVGLVPSEPIPSGATAIQVSLLYRLALIAGSAYVLQALAQFTSRYLFQATAGSWGRTMPALSASNPTTGARISKRVRRGYQDGRFPSVSKHGQRKRRAEQR